MKNRKNITVYAATAVAAATMTLTASIPASAAVRMFVVNGNSSGNGNGYTNGMMNGTCYGGAGQNMDLSDILSSLCPGLSSSLPSCGASAPEMDILRPNLPDNNGLNPGQTNWNCPGQNNWWNGSNQNWPGINCPDQNQPDQNQPSQPNQPVNPNPVQPPQGGSTDTSYAQQVIDLVNEERAKAGLAPVNASEAITQAANVRAQEIVTNFSHTRPDGSSFSTALRQAGVSYMGSGENIAYGQRTPKEVMDGWMNSSGHRANILNANYKNIGIGYYENNGVKYWVQLFTY